MELSDGLHLWGKEEEDVKNHTRFLLSKISVT